ncbi:hypothetical protein CsSME_00042147 [Camellia sinensis var. sinensis]
MCKSHRWREISRRQYEHPLALGGLSQGQLGGNKGCTHTILNCDSILSSCPISLVMSISSSQLPSPRYWFFGSYYWPNVVPESISARCLVRSLAKVELELGNI